MIALDVGYGQLHPRLRSDDRGDRARARQRARASTSLPFAPELVVCDVSFISVKTALPPLLRLAAPGLGGARPRQAAVRGRAGRRAEGASSATRRCDAASLRDVCAAAARWGSKVAGVVDSGLPGPKGNREFLVHLIDSPEPTDPDELERWIDDAVG